MGRKRLLSGEGIDTGASRLSSEVADDFIKNAQDGRSVSFHPCRTGKHK